MDKKTFLEFEIGYIMINLNWFFPIKPSEIKISFSVESYDENTTKNNRNC